MDAMDRINAWANRVEDWMEAHPTLSYAVLIPAFALFVGAAVFTIS